MENSCVLLNWTKMIQLVMRDKPHAMLLPMQWKVCYKTIVFIDRSKAAQGTHAPSSGFNFFYFLAVIWEKIDQPSQPYGLVLSPCLGNCGSATDDPIYWSFTIVNDHEFKHDISCPTGDRAQVVYVGVSDTTPLWIPSPYYFNGFTGFRIWVIAVISAMNFCLAFHQ